MMPTSTAGKSNNQAGFTLIELALVVVLLGLLAGLALPMLNGLGSNALEISARRLAGTVKYLYNEAVMTGLEHRLIFDLKDHGYQSARLNPAGELEVLQGTGKPRSLGAGVRFSDIYQPRRGEQTSGNVVTALLPGGWLEETIIHLQDENDRQLTLRLVPLTGLTEIYPGRRDFR
jgi:general secretion pathway protein H